jgi:hypothetical protein
MIVTGGAVIPVPTSGVWYDGGATAPAGTSPVIVSVTALVTTTADPPTATAEVATTGVVTGENNINGSTTSGVVMGTGTAVVINNVEAGAVVAVTVILLVRFPVVSKLTPPVLVDSAITEVNVDVEKIVPTLSTVEAGMMMVELETPNVVNMLRLVEIGAVVVNVEYIVVTVNPQPAGIMLGPPGKHDAKPGY